MRSKLIGISAGRDVALPGAITPRLTLDMSAAAAFQTIAHATIDHFLLAQARVRFLSDKDGVHQGRVALRRFSAAWRLFSPLVAGDRCQCRERRFAAHQKSVARRPRPRRAFGRSREMFGQECRPAGGARPQASRSATGKGICRACFDAQSAGDGSVLLRIVAWIDAGEWTRDAARAKDRDEPIGDFRSAQIQQAHPKIRAACDDAGRGEPDGAPPHADHMRKICAMAWSFSIILCGSPAVRKLTQRSARLCRRA